MSKWNRNLWINVWKGGFIIGPIYFTLLPAQQRVYIKASLKVMVTFKLINNIKKGYQNLFQKLHHWAVLEPWYIWPEHNFISQIMHKLLRHSQSTSCLVTMFGLLLKWKLMDNLQQEAEENQQWEVWHQTSLQGPLQLFPDKFRSLEKHICANIVNYSLDKQWLEKCHLLVLWP